MHCDYANNVVGAFGVIYLNIEICFCSQTSFSWSSFLDGFPVPIAPFTQMLQTHMHNIHAPANPDQLVNEVDDTSDNRTVVVDSIYPSAQLSSARYTTKI